MRLAHFKKESTMPLIYQPTGKAREYSPLALNIYNGCDHGCTYCYVPLIRRDSDNNKVVKMRKDFLSILDKELSKNLYKEQVLLSFMCDPYSNFEMEYGLLTRETLIRLNDKKCKVSILTKGGSRCLRDIDIFKQFGNRIKVGATLTLVDEKQSAKTEPRAALPKDRLHTLKLLHEAGVKTWVSIEPVIEPIQSLELIQQSLSFVDQYKVGKMNHFEKRFNPYIDWKKFMRDAVEALRVSKKQFYVKEDLRVFDIDKILLPEECNMDALNL